MTKAKRLEFKENRTSWKWFANKFNRDFDIRYSLKTPDTYTNLILLEILKELQYLNDKSL
jgi:hypothetical protein